MQWQRFRRSGPVGRVKRWDGILHSDDRPETPRWHLTVALVAAAVAGACSFWVATRQYGPTVHPDEWGFLLNGQVIVGHSEVQVPTGSFYPAGFGVVTGALALLTGSMAGQYRATLIVNFLLCLVVAWLARRVALRVFGLSGRMSWLAGALAFVAPGTIVSSLYSWPETAARVAFLLFVLGFHRVAETRSSTRVLVFGALIGFMPVLHGRFTLVLPVACVVILWWGFRRDISRAVAVGSCALATVAYLAGRSLNKMVKHDLYAQAWGQEDRLLKRIVDPSLWPALVRTMTGQTWYLIVTSGGLFMAAVFLVVRYSRSAPLRSAIDEPRRLTVLVIGASTALLVFTGGLQLLYGSRGDHLVYGRYVEILVPALLVTGCAAVESMPRTARRAWIVSAGASVLIAAFYVVVDGGDGVKGGWVRRNIVYPNIVGFDALRYVVRPGLITWGCATGAIALVLWWLSRSRDTRAVTALVVLLAVGSTWSITRTLPGRTDDLESTTVIPAYVETHGGSLIGYDGQVPNDAMYYYLRYKLHPAQVVRLFASGPGLMKAGEGDPVPAEISCVVGFRERPLSHGEWSIVADEPTMRRVLWQRVGTDHC